MDFIGEAVRHDTHLMPLLNFSGPRRNLHVESQHAPAYDQCRDAEDFPSNGGQSLTYSSHFAAGSNGKHPECQNSRFDCAGNKLARAGTNLQHAQLHLSSSTAVVGDALGNLRISATDLPPTPFTIGTWTGNILGDLDSVRSTHAESLMFGQLRTDDACEIHGPLTETEGEKSQQKESLADIETPSNQHDTSITINKSNLKASLFKTMSNTNSQGSLQSAASTLNTSQNRTPIAQGVNKSNNSILLLLNQFLTLILQLLLNQFSTLTPFLQLLLNQFSTLNNCLLAIARVG
jgi:hypothetical protein